MPRQPHPFAAKLRELRQPHDAGAIGERFAANGPQPATPSAPSVHSNGSIDEAALYQRFKARLLQEAPALVKLTLSRPEIELTIERPTIQVDTSTNEGKVLEMVALGHFDTPINGNQAYKWLVAHRGYNSKSARIYEAIAELVKKAILFKTSEAKYQKAEGAAVRIKK